MYHQNEYKYNETTREVVDYETSEKSQIITMASPIGSLTRLEEPDYVEAWLDCFAALSRNRKWQDQVESDGTNEITNQFMAYAGCEAIMKIKVMVFPRDIQRMSFREIEQAIRKDVRPKKKLVIAERTKFLATKQNPGESVRNYIHRLKQASRFCEFEKLGSGSMSIHEELLQLRFIEGLHEQNKKIKHWNDYNLTTWLWNSA